MANKLVAVFLMCIVLSATMQIRKADAIRSLEDKEYASIFKKCMKGCFKDGQHYTFCEVKCDEDTENELEKIMSQLKNKLSPLSN